MNSADGRDAPRGGPGRPVTQRRGYQGPLPEAPVIARPATSLRDRSLRWFVLFTLGFTAWRMVLAVAFLLFGPPLEVEARLWTTQVFFVLSKAFLGGLFWPVGLLIGGWRDPLAWLVQPW